MFELNAEKPLHLTGNRGTALGDDDQHRVIGATAYNEQIAFRRYHRDLIGWKIETVFGTRALVYPTVVPGQCSFGYHRFVIAIAQVNVQSFEMLLYFGLPKDFYQSLVRVVFVLITAGGVSF